MKKCFLPLAFLFVLSNISAQNIDEVLAKYETANGGKNAFASIKTLQYTSTVSMNMMGMPIDITMTNIFVMGKLYRRQTSGMMGMKGSYTLVTDTAGYTSTPTVPAYGDFPGMDGGIKKMDAETLQKLQSKLKSIDEFSTLVDAKAKGNVTELLGITKVDKVECYKIKLTAKDNDVATYYVDTTTMLIKQVELSGKKMASVFGLDSGPMAEMAGKRVDKQRVTILYTEYKDINGIKFPTKQKMQFGAADISIENSDVEINESIAAKWFKAN